MGTAYRWFKFHNRELVGAVFQSLQHPWQAGVNDAICLVDRNHMVPERWCTCGFTCSTNIAAIAAHAAQWNDAIHLGMKLHQDNNRTPVPRGLEWTLATTMNDSFILAEISTHGRDAPACSEDDPQWYYRVQSATLKRFYVPAVLRGHQDYLMTRYAADVVIAEQSGRAWLDTFADGIAPTPEQLGCASCPRPNPGVEEYPLCAVCANRFVSGCGFNLGLTVREITALQNRLNRLEQQKSRVLFRQRSTT